MKRLDYSCFLARNEIGITIEAIEGTSPLSNNESLILPNVYSDNLRVDREQWRGRWRTFLALFVVQHEVIENLGLQLAPTELLSVDFLFYYKNSRWKTPKPEINYLARNYRFTWQNVSNTHPHPTQNFPLERRKQRTRVSTYVIRLDSDSRCVLDFSKEILTSAVEWCAQVFHDFEYAQENINMLSVPSMTRSEYCLEYCDFAAKDWWDRDSTITEKEMIASSLWFSL